MRAIAVGMVVIYHLYPSLLRGGFAGVDVFFVISGFLITGHLLREYQKTGRIALLDFWGRRAKRLVPAAALVLTVTWLASRLLLPATQARRTPHPRSGRARCTTRTGSSRGTRSTTSRRTARRARCSISGRCPSRSSSTSAGRCCSCWRRSWRSRRGAGPGRPAAITCALLLAGVVVAGSLWYSVYDTRANPAGAYFVTTTRIWELGLGGLLALAPARLSQRIGRLGALGWAGLGLVVASAFVLSGTDAFPGYLALLPAAAPPCWSSAARRRAASGRTG